MDILVAVTVGFLVAGSLFVLVLLMRAPQGWEDENGFHRTSTSADRETSPVRVAQPKGTLAPSAAEPAHAGSAVKLQPQVATAAR